MKIFLIALILFFTVVGLLSFVFIVFNQAFFNTSFIIDTELASKFGSFFGGYVGTIFSILSALLLTYTIITQNIENRKDEVRNHFFKMLDFHNETVKEISISHIDSEKSYQSEGRRAFVVFKIQIKRLLELIRKLNEEEKWGLNEIQQLDVAYIVFYYGLDTTWTTFIADKLKTYPNHKVIITKLLVKIKENPKLKLGRTNQTILSTYFRNMYNALKLVDDNKFLELSEKQDLIKIYRAQLSNPELYILFFNLMSRFGKKWKEKDFVVKYRFIKNIPKGYCDGYEPSEYFKMTYEDDEQ
jgi:hypothetical protein